MPIEPTKPGSNPNVFARTPHAAQTPSASSDAKRDAGATAPGERNRTHLSDAVRELLARHGVEEIPTGALSSERMQVVLDRIRKGHYEGPEIRDEILGRLQAEIEGEPGVE